MKMLLSVGLLCPFFLTAQVQYSDFSLVQQNNVVLIRWTVKSGSLCNGTTIFRKNPGGEDVQVAAIDGICGSEIADLNYSAIDTDPVLNASNTYFIRFGFGEFSEQESIFVRYLDPEELYLSPNPASTTLKIEWNDTYKETYTIEIIAASGKVIYTQRNVLGTVSEIPVQELQAGVYTVRLTAESGRTLVRQWLR